MATRSSLMDFQTPKIVSEDADERSGRFTIEPLDRGFGYTFGNSLRRVLLSSLEGAAVTAVKIEGVAHEFTTLPGVREDVTDIILNLKELVCRLHGESPEIEVHLSKKGAGAVTAADIEAPADLEILNPDLELAHLADKGKLEMTLTIGRGRGYLPADLNRGPETTLGVIPIDSIFSPVRRVAYEVDAARVGQRTDYDKLVLDVTTDGSVAPKDAIAGAAEILNPELEIAHLADKGKLEMTLTIGRGRGYVPADQNRGPETTIGVIPIDSIFSPVRRVSYEVDSARVGQRTDYDKLVLEVTTDGSIEPKEAIARAAELLIDQLRIFADPARIEGFGELAAAAEAEVATTSHGMENFPIEELELGVRSYNCLKRVGIETIGDLTSKSENELAAIPNFGRKSIEEVRETLAAHGLTLKGEELPA
ncbi:MAG TPA: DNA-directed RNA polymerase subunit alpha [Gaiella sp.]|uniref:DNA-directed RNA polymerase subunit alpha n=1 Tax=Gaiella sp. TaxID=2663207 RepID=UPI002D7E388F|nr:DNA-directed RNA polymerase subunit alpha [Gaiella sp.]HET9286594.1 DNA-directed RNA polymerase subunit alpha [Gaiella sp.]